jgi:hypothetical protein
MQRTHFCSHLALNFSPYASFIQQAPRPHHSHSPPPRAVTNPLLPSRARAAHSFLPSSVPPTPLAQAGNTHRFFSFTRCIHKPISPHPPKIPTTTTTNPPSFRTVAHPCAKKHPGAPKSTQKHRFAPQKRPNAPLWCNPLIVIILQAFPSTCRTTTKPRPHPTFYPLFSALIPQNPPLSAIKYNVIQISILPHPHPSYKNILINA